MFLGMVAIDEAHIVNMIETEGVRDPSAMNREKDENKPGFLKKAADLTNSRSFSRLAFKLSCMAFCSRASLFLLAVGHALTLEEANKLLKGRCNLLVRP
ncbi:MAG TPA: hypothetical protein PK966_08050 [Syntrophorhabdaceae bacterium]|nr:hypothetical protein [Syntrophorhabdaceae bacterium]